MTKGRVLQIRVHSPGLEGNLLGDPADQDVAVYLPPSYETAPDRRYPVIYVLHGFADNYLPWAEGMGEAIDALVATRVIGEMIVVSPNGRNAYLSCYFTDSPVTGNWETYLSRDLVAFVDRTFRTLAEPAHRAILGHSKGGFTAIRMGMDHPEVFGVVYAMSPCCLSLEAAVAEASPVVWREANRASQEGVRTVRRRVEEGKGSADDTYLIGAIAMAAAFSPNPRHQPLLVDLPYTEADGAVQPQPKALAQWQAASPLNRVGAERAALLRLRALAIDYGLDDAFSDIPRSTRTFCFRLAEEGIPHSCEAYEGGHEDRLRKRIPEVVLPFLSRVMGPTP